MADYLCEFCGWNKGKSAQALATHKRLWCKKNPEGREYEGSKAQEPVLEGTTGEPGLQAGEPQKDKDALIAELQAKVKSLESEKATDKDWLEFENGARYEKVGNCMTCNMSVYQCRTHPVRFDGGVGVRLAVWVPGARPPVPMPGEEGLPEPPTMYCQVHDPTRHLRHAGKSRDEILRQEDWEPIAVRL